MLLLLILNLIIKTNKRINFSNGYFWILQSNFNNLNDNYGGAIFLQNVYNSLIEDCLFFNCFANLSGGAINVMNTSLNRICAINCYLNSEHHGQFGSILNTKNISYLSIFKCSSIDLNRRSSLSINSEEINYQNTNISFNQLKYCSTIWIINQNKGIFQFSIFISNHASDKTHIHDICICFQTTNTTLFNSNIINNTKEGTKFGIVHITTNANVIIDKCYFKLNSQFYLFSCHSILLLIKNCYSDNYSKSGFVNFLSTNGLIISNYLITIFKTNLCDAHISLDYISPMIFSKSKIILSNFKVFTIFVIFNEC